MECLKEQITTINILHGSLKLKFYFCLRLMNKIYLMSKAISLKCHLMKCQGIVFLNT